MSPLRRLCLLVLAVMAPLLGGAKCGGGNGDGDGRAIRSIEDGIDPRCSTLPALFPPGFAFVPGGSGRLLAANVSSPAGLVPLIASQHPFTVPPGEDFQATPNDSDGDGVVEPPSEPRPIIDDVFAVGTESNLLLVTMSGYEQVYFSDADGRARKISVQVPAELEAWRYPRLPAPGAEPAERIALSTFACVAPGSQSLDSRGDRIADSVPPFVWCKPGEVSFPAAFTSGVALAAGHLFVSVSNLLNPLPRNNPLYGPGAVLVFDIDALDTVPALAPNARVPALITSGFNPTEVTAYTSPAGREFVLVANSGAVGILDDDPQTAVFEAGTLALSEGSIDVIDAAALRVVATYPFVGGNPGFRQIAIDPAGRVAMLGHVARKEILGVDLAPLDRLPPADRLGPDDPPIRLDGSRAGFDDAVLFDARTPLRLLSLAGGPPESACPGRVESLAFNEAGGSLFAVEECDGAFATISLDLSGTPTTLELRERIGVERVESLSAPLGADSVGRLQQPASLHVRPGRPGIDFDGPDVFFTLGSPEGTLCGIRVDSPQR